MHGISQQTGQSLAPLTIIVARYRVAQPVEGLDDAHGGATRPMKFAGSRVLECDGEIAEFDRLGPGFAVHDDFCRHGIGEAEIVGSGHAVNQHADLVAPCNGVDDSPWIGSALLLGQAVKQWLVIKPTVDPPQFAPFNEALERLVDRVASAKIEKIRGRPDSTRHTLANAVEDEGFEARRLGVHVRNLYHNFGHCLCRSVRKM